MKKILKNRAAFIALYILILIPTYVLPYFGSNSGVLNTAGAVGGIGINPLFWLHLLALLILVWMTWIRGSLSSKGWIAIFPFFALLFDLVPILNLFALFPTGMHMLAMIFGISSPSRVVLESKK